eukprot:6750605-Pyramimonas_sp.AAC.1
MGLFDYMCGVGKCCDECGAGEFYVMLLQDNGEIICRMPHESAPKYPCPSSPPLPDWVAYVQIAVVERRAVLLRSDGSAAVCGWGRCCDENLVPGPAAGA